MASSRDMYLRRTYGITETEYTKLLMLQKGVCFICQKPPKEGGRRLAVDHEHTKGERKLPDGERQRVIRGKVRGLLCSIHNRAIAKFRDNVNYLLRAALYLEKPPARKVLSRQKVNQPKVNQPKVRQSKTTSNQRKE